MPLNKTLFVLFYLFCPFPGFADAPPTTPLQKGVFLVATKNLHGTSFEKTVILITQYDQRGAVGIAINRPSSLPLPEAFPKLKKQSKLSDKFMYLGGPVHPYAVLILEQGKRDMKGLQHVFADIYMSAGMESLDQILSLKETSSFVTYSGYAGWAPKQLENEITRGDWMVVKAEKKYIFHPHADQVWQTIRTAWAGYWI